MNEKLIAIRMDDFHNKCSIDNWDYLINSLIENQIPCHVGIIAFNKDFSICYRNSPCDIWTRAREWQKKGVNFWIHGYSHTLKKSKLKFNFSNKGEFFNESFDEINRKINSVINLFDQNGIIPFGFFAPAHGYTNELIKVLISNPRINFVWDGSWNSPREIFGLKFLPQQFWRIYPSVLRPRFSGICLHPSAMSKREMDNFLRNALREKKRIFNIDFNKLTFPSMTWKDAFFEKVFYFLKFCKKFAIKIYSLFLSK